MLGRLLSNFLVSGLAKDLLKRPEGKALEDDLEIGPQYANSRWREIERACFPKISGPSEL
jgi:hypothetical protein